MHMSKYSYSCTFNYSLISYCYLLCIVNFRHEEKPKASNVVEATSVHSCHEVSAETNSPKTNEDIQNNNRLINVLEPIPRATEVANISSRLNNNPLINVPEPISRATEVANISSRLNGFDQKQQPRQSASIPLTKHHLNKLVPALDPIQNKSVPSPNHRLTEEACTEEACTRFTAFHAPTREEKQRFLDGIFNW